jgi:nicotinamidase-related amidase
MFRPQDEPLLRGSWDADVCDELTPRPGDSAQQRDFQVTVVADCTSAPEDQHEAALAVMAYIFATVGPWRDGLAARTAA